MTPKKTKILLVTAGISRLVKPLLESPYTIVGVLESMPKDYDPLHKEHGFIRMLKFIYYTIVGRERTLMQLCNDRHILYNFLYKKNYDEIANWVKKIEPDLIVIYSMSQLLKKDIIDIPTYGVINLHPSFLPDYRGPNPDFWYYYNVDLNPGITVHYVDEGEDTGDIIFQEKVSIPLGIKSPERLDKLIGEHGVKLVLKSIETIINGTAPRYSQPFNSTTIRARNIKLDEHTGFINWDTWDIERIWHFLRGTETWLNAIPQPKGLLSGHRWAVCEFEKNINLNLKPGTIAKYRGKRCIALKSGIIYIKVNVQIQLVLLYLLSFYKKK